jgi:major membrane immunogen (membrane-anchored lipoprotein)
MIRKKLAVTALSVVLTASLLAGCGAATETTKETTAAVETTASAETTAAVETTAAAETTVAAETTAAEKKGIYKDGTYTAEAKDFDAKSGWKSTISITVTDGYIATVDWNGLNKKGGDDKKTVSKAGNYGMKANGGSLAEWHEEAALVEKFLIEKQDVAAITLKGDGKTDAISGATIAVSDFVELATQALASAK